VCGGLAQYFNLDAMLIRVLFVVLAVLGDSGLALAFHGVADGRGLIVKVPS
jgi:phage shock protein PspC (stress-responsive transcriptional regulator)